MKPSTEVICRELGDAAVLIHLRTNEIFELNPTGYRIWQMVGSGIARDAMADQLAREFDVGTEHVRREIEHLLADLSARHLIVDDDGELVKIC